MAKLRTDGGHRVAIDGLLADVEAAFTGPLLRAPFVERGHGVNIPRLSGWLNTTARVVQDQFTRGGKRSTRPTTRPLSTSPLDAFSNPIRAAIQPRAYGLKNRERTNPLLMLMQLHANRADDVDTYAHLIRECLQSNNGRPVAARRAVVDIRGRPFLRSLGEAGYRISKSILGFRMLSEMRWGGIA